MEGAAVGHLYTLTVGGILFTILTQPFLMMLCNQLLIEVTWLEYVLFGELIQPECVQESWLLNQKILFEALGEFHLKANPGTMITWC